MNALKQMEAAVQNTKSNTDPKEESTMFNSLKRLVSDRAQFGKTQDNSRLVRIVVKVVTVLLAFVIGLAASVPATAQQQLYVDGSQLQVTAQLKCSDYPMQEINSVAANCWGWLQTHTYALGGKVTLKRIEADVNGGPSEINAVDGPFFLEVSSDGVNYKTIARFRAIVAPNGTTHVGPFQVPATLNPVSFVRIRAGVDEVGAQLYVDWSALRIKASLKCGSFPMQEIAQVKANCWGWLQTHTYAFGGKVTIEQVEADVNGGPSELNRMAGPFYLEASQDGVNYTQIATFGAIVAANGFTHVGPYAGPFANVTHLRVRAGLCDDGCSVQLDVKIINPGKGAVIDLTKTVKITAQVTNNGKGKLDNVEIRFEFDDQLIGTKKVTNLNSGRSKQVTLNWKPATMPSANQPGNHQLTVRTGELASATTTLVWVGPSKLKNASEVLAAEQSAPTNETEIRLISLDGRPVAVQSIPSGAMLHTVPGLANGVYLAQIVTRDVSGRTIKVELKKVIVVR